MESGEVVAQAHLQTFFDVVERTVDSDLQVLPRGSCSTFEPGSREPRRNVSHYKTRSAGGIALFLRRVQIGNVSTRKAPGTVTSSKTASALCAAAKKGSSWDSMLNPYVTDMINAPVALRLG